MIAMQYSFVLPADYDMAIVERRIREKGPLFDGFPHLRLKAFLSARKQGAIVRAPRTSMRPFIFGTNPMASMIFSPAPALPGWRKLSAGRR